ncbi:MAG TPA: hypothetical protein VFU47_08110, partial [Armatimonadota bacterium]|nr:hypothetical protein [Armatimonadota bacterium]
GYANVFPRTQLGKLVAAIVMMIGPALTSWVVEGRLVQRQATPPAAEEPQPETAAVLEKLELILQELKALNRSA